MDPDRPVHCARDADGNVWRIQCNDATKVCLYAPNSELDSDGKRTKPLERARACPAFDRKPFRRAEYEARGYAILPGRPDAPHGWTRDDRGRVFQINFDLTRRLYLGTSYAPMAADLPGVADADRVAVKRSAIDFAFFVFEHYGGAENPNRHRVRLVEGEVFLEPFSADIVLARYDLSRRFLDPLLRVTTFLGRPRRHDLHVNIGLWTEAAHLEVHDNPVHHSQLWRFATAQATLDLWQSAKLDSFARIRSGAGVERLFAGASGARTAITLSSALELAWIVDRTGFHNLWAELSYEQPRYFAAHPLFGPRAQRLRTRLLYEAVLVAINDQPLTLKLGIGSEKRNDIPGVPERWAFVGNAGLRFSLWAPPRPPD